MGENVETKMEKVEIQFRFNPFPNGSGNLTLFSQILSGKNEIVHMTCSTPDLFFVRSPRSLSRH
jgi:hypothetical protein